MEDQKTLVDPVCTQEQCIFRDEQLAPDFVAEVVLRLVSGEGVSDLLPEERRVTRYERCTRCARAVLEGGRPLPTVHELKLRIESGRRSYRRRLRRAC